MVSLGRVRTLSATASMVETRPTVSAVVCTRNRAAFLADVVRDLAAGLRDTDELIVVESGDSRAREALAELPPSLRTTHLRSAIPGKSHKLNQAIRAARGEVLVITDDDARVDPRWADAMAVEFEDLTVGIAFGPVHGLTQHAERPWPVLRPGEAPVETWSYAHGVSMAVRRVAAYHVGGFDERLGPGAPAHGEEHDLLIRLWERGWRAVIADAPAAAHRDWRSPAEDHGNLLTYERGSGASLGAALRRHPLRWTSLARLRLRNLQQTVRESPIGPKLLRAFAGGLGYGLLLDERRWLVAGDQGN